MESGRTAGIRLVVAFLALLGVLSSNAQVSGTPSTEQAEAFERDGSYLIKRYESGTSMFRIGEDIQIIWGPGNNKFQDAKYVVRICSKEKLLPSLPSATVNVIEFTDFLTSNGGYKKSDVLFIRSENCENGKKGDLFPTELWVVKTESNLPSHVEYYRFDQLTILSLGFDPVSCAKTSYKESTAKLIRKMARDPKGYGAIVEYYLEKPAMVLHRNTRRAVRIMAEHGITAPRLRVSTQAWHDGDSGCINKEPSQPRIFFMTVKNRVR